MILNITIHPEKSNANLYTGGNETYFILSMRTLRRITLPGSLHESDFRSKICGNNICNDIALPDIFYRESMDDRPPKLPKSSYLLTILPKSAPREAIPKETPKKKNPKG